MHPPGPRSAPAGLFSGSPRLQDPPWGSPSRALNWKDRIGRKAITAHSQEKAKKTTQIIIQTSTTKNNIQTTPQKVYSNTSTPIKNNKNRTPIKDKTNKRPSKTNKNKKQKVIFVSKKNIKLLETTKKTSTKNNPHRPSSAPSAPSQSCRAPRSAWSALRAVGCSRHRRPPRRRSGEWRFGAVGGGGALGALVSLFWGSLFGSFVFFVDFLVISFDVCFVWASVW